MVGLSICGKAVECNLRPWHPIPIIVMSQDFFLACEQFCKFVRFARFARFASFKHTSCFFNT